VLAGYQLAGGGFATFQPGSYASWTRAHPDVTPVAVRALAPYGYDDASRPRAAASPRGPRRVLVGSRLVHDRDVGRRVRRARWFPSIPRRPPPRRRTPCSMPPTCFAIACAAGWHTLVDELADRLLAAADARRPVAALAGPARHGSRRARAMDARSEAGGRLYADVHGVYSTAVIISVLTAWWR